MQKSACKLMQIEMISGNSVLFNMGDDNFTRSPLEAFMVAFASGRGCFSVSQILTLVKNFMSIIKLSHQNPVLPPQMVIMGDKVAVKFGLRLFFSGDLAN